MESAKLRKQHLRVSHPMLLLDVGGMLLVEAVLTVEVVAGASSCSPAPASSWMTPWLMSWGAEAASTECRSCSTTNSPSPVSYKMGMSLTVSLLAKEEQKEHDGGIYEQQLTCTSNSTYANVSRPPGMELSLCIRAVKASSVFSICSPVKPLCTVNKVQASENAVAVA